jgi:hypothetical protein
MNGRIILFSLAYRWLEQPYQLKCLLFSTGAIHLLRTPHEYQANLESDQSRFFLLAR